MDTLLGYVPEVLAAASALWGWRQRSKRRAAEALAAAARAALVKRLQRVGDIGTRFAEAMADGDIEAMRAIERERKRAGL